MRWNKKYGGTDESLFDKSHRLKSKHPNSHTDEEIKWINDLIRINYKRHPSSLYRVVKRISKHSEIIKNTSKYTPRR